MSVRNALSVRNAMSVKNANQKRDRESGFTLIEMIVVVFLLAIAMLGILAVFDASARINKSEQDVADAQGAVRFGIYQMTRAIRMAGAGGLFVTQAVVNAPDPDLPGIVVASARGYDNVTGATVRDLNTGAAVPVRDGTDMIEIRGVINSPLIGFDLSSGCGSCTGSTAVAVRTTTFTTVPLQHVNDDPQRPQFSAIDTYTAGVTAVNPMMVIVAANDDIHGGCSVPGGAQQYSQPSYNVGLLTAPTTLVASQTFGTVNFASAVALEFDPETPAESGASAQNIANVRRAGVLDDLIFFIDNTDPNHPALAQGTRRGNRFDVVHLADDVEDMQIAYGVDRDNNNAINRNAGFPLDPVTDPDLNVSTAAGGDEWRPNVAGEPVWLETDFQFLQPPPANFTHPGNPAANHCPTLHGVMVSLIAKSKDPDPTYKSPSALGFLTMNSPATVNPPHPDVAQYPTLSAEPHFRRRVQTLKINLRNYAFPG